MTNTIHLKFDLTLTGLAGYKYGKQVYEEQVKDKINFSEKIIIYFPGHIVRLASSFIQGFFDEIVATIGIEGIEKNIEIESVREDMKEIIIKNLL